MKQIYFLLLPFDLAVVIFSYGIQGFGMLLFRPFKLLLKLEALSLKRLIAFIDYTQGEEKGANGGNATDQSDDLK